ncbi:HpcH/HpaI aldolase family protein [Leptospira kanakyensis]|uniref:HpcH/HpaI aldolase family protein n=1 Tax=Leptospira kanakyensis TaxID=2484968 RepID=UPI00223CA84E|nr:aldolase/citrate lyase family protein [Leptospira kanakyensis]MCW7482130.1 aldolase/citrate lyase family protein [Leptospira kanakyensis]
MNRIENIVRIRNKLKQGKPSIGTWMQIPSGSIAEILGYAGYDWVTVDLEHGSISTSQLPDLFRSIELGGTLPLARLAKGSLKDCKSALDAGAGGVILPMIESEEQIRECIEWSCWPPMGKRGVGFSRANLFGKYFNEYRSESQNPLIVAQIEHINAVNNLEKILKCDGLDAIMIGPYDLSASMNITAEFEDSKFIEIINRIKEVSKKHNIPSGLHIVKPEIIQLRNRIEEGYQFLAYSIDSVFLNDSCQNPISTELQR